MQSQGFAQEGGSCPLMILRTGPSSALVYIDPPKSPEFLDLPGRGGVIPAGVFLQVGRRHCLCLQS
jgi:hypothetical protein